MNVLILAGGFGTRMYPLTKDLPKALIKIKGKPVIEYILEQLNNTKDIEIVYIFSNNKFYINFIEWLDSFKKRAELSKKIKIINNGVNNENEKKGALQDFAFAISSMIIKNKENLLVMSSDDLFEFDLRELFYFSKRKNSSVVALKMLDKEEIKKFSCVLLDENNRITYFEEKPENPISNICATACYFIIKEDIEKLRIAIDKELNKDKLGYILKLLIENSKIYGKIFESSSLVRIGELNLFQNFPFLGCRKDNFDPLFKSG